MHKKKHKNFSLFERQFYSKPYFVFIGPKIILLFSSKCYYINNESQIKRSHKGTPKFVVISAEDYERALFDDQVLRVQFNRIVVDPRLGTATTKLTNKRAINPCYLKMHVLSDNITVRPHCDKNGPL